MAAYDSLIAHENRIVLTLDTVTVENPQIKPSDDFILYIGSVRLPTSFPVKFQYKERSDITHEWNLFYNKPETAAFMVSLYKHRTLAKDEFYGDCRVNISEIPPDNIVKISRELKVNGRLMGHFTLSAHISENGESTANIAPTFVL